ncbi:3-oxoacyl-[acyl-carrier-protein] synthase III C-terminal domain-containing protein [Luteimonas sp. RD2P54]|uniref:3-oxoacyl-[acyl-carrier-protein] synthase III C-terminal domain-containing protein n=1 Tax=Luteimonas endophytica TaxID=3042023 RepID=A0ABT6J8K7_9GAMM|nr:iron-containing redox enzyme family protein [Luteimonas endophytica]MDH5823157.1 3-oxoacyl-[acyl-carrier-protein] synthase III C-terminal domain-containing protein [Luteimonas endophytica]
MRFEDVYITATGAFYPGPAVDNDAIDRYIEPLNALSPRLKRRILGENGIRTRHYAIDTGGNSTHSCAGLAAAAVRACLGAEPADALRGIELLAAATSSGDLMLPGFANMVQAELGAPAMATASHHGVCASGMAALQHAALALELGAYGEALVATAEFPSRLFKRSRFAQVGYNADFDAHFLRWMLSDGAGAWRLSRRRPASGLALRLRHLHLKSFSGELPLCMQAGLSPEGRHWGDYPSFSEADAAGAMLLRQDIRLLPQLFDVATHEYVKLAEAGAIDPAAVDHFLCHYSSQRFAPVVRQCLELAQLEIPESRWYSNLAVRGNLGSASIFTMLDDFLRERQPQAGETVLLFVPESGRFTVAFALLEVVDAAEAARPPAPMATALRPAAAAAAPGAVLPEPPHSPDPASQLPEVARLLRELALVWHDYRSRVWRTRLVRRILDGSVTKDDYVGWMEQWVPQVRQGSLWMRKAADHLTPRYAALHATVHHHADDEQYDYDVLFRDYRNAGGKVASLDELQRNPGGEALNAYLHARAAQPDAVGLLGAMYIIEGTGQRIVPALLPLLRQRLGWLGKSFTFLAYHGENDIAHLGRWLRALEATLEIGGRGAADEILEDARHVAVLYARQLEMIR